MYLLLTAYVHLYVYIYVGKVNQEDIFDTMEKKTKAGRERAGASARVQIDLTKVYWLY